MNIKFVCLSLCPYYAFLNGWIDFDEIVCVRLSGFRDDLDSQTDLVGSILGGAQTEIGNGGFWL